MASKKDKPTLIVNGRRLDGRVHDQLRALKIVAGVIENADGSAYIELGNNKIIAAVYGPREVQPKHLTEVSKAIIKCRYSMSPFASIEGHGRSGPNRRATEISKVIKEVFESTVLLTEFPESQIDIFIEVLQADGSTRSAGITAAAVALANAGMPMRDIPFGVSIGKAEGELVVDLNMLEDNYSECDMAVAIAPRNNEILLLQMDGSLSKHQLKKGIELAIEAGKQLSAAQREALKQVYSSNEASK